MKYPAISVLVLNLLLFVHFMFKAVLFIQIEEPGVFVDDHYPFLTQQKQLVNFDILRNVWIQLHAKEDGPIIRSKWRSLAINASKAVSGWAPSPRWSADWDPRSVDFGTGGFGHLWCAWRCLARGWLVLFVSLLPLFFGPSLRWNRNLSFFHFFHHPYHKVYTDVWYFRSDWSFFFYYEAGLIQN